MGPERISEGDANWKEPVEAEEEVSIPSEILLAIQEVPNLEIQKLLFEYASLQEQRITLKVAGKKYDSAQIGLHQQEVYTQINDWLRNNKEDGLKILIAIALIERRSETKEDIQDGN